MPSFHYLLDNLPPSIVIDEKIKKMCSTLFDNVSPYLPLGEDLEYDLAYTSEEKGSSDVILFVKSIKLNRQVTFIVLQSTTVKIIKRDENGKYEHLYTSGPWPEQERVWRQAAKWITLDDSEDFDPQIRRTQPYKRYVLEDGLYEEPNAHTPRKIISIENNYFRDRNQAIQWLIKRKALTEEETKEFMSSLKTYPMDSTMAFNLDLQTPCRN